MLMDFLSDFRGRQTPSAAIPEALAALPPPSPQPSVPDIPPPPAPVLSPPLNGNKTRPSRPPEFHAPVAEPAAPQLDFAPPAPARDLSKAWASAILSHSWVQKARSVVETWLSWEQRSRSGVENPQATGSMFLGLFSLFLPVLAVPSILLGVRSLRVVSLEPWRKGRVQSIVGITASAVLGPISAALWIWMFVA